MPDPTDLALATAALRSLAEVYPTATNFRANMRDDGLRTIAEIEAAGPTTDEAFLAAKAAFLAATGVPATK